MEQEQPRFPWEAERTTRRSLQGAGADVEITARSRNQTSGWRRALERLHQHVGKQHGPPDTAPVAHARRVRQIAFAVATHG